MRKVTWQVLSGLLAVMSLGMMPIAHAELNMPVLEQAAPSSDEIPIYTPPKKITPRARVGGSLRGTEGSDPEIVALVPDHVGLTVKQNPVLNWFLSKPTSYPLRFTLSDTRVVKPIYEGPVPTPTQPGIQSLDLKKLGLALKPDIQYRWYISAIRNEESPSNDIVAGGVIERCEFNACLVETDVNLTCDRHSVQRNAMKGFWYDAMACLCALIDASPTDAPLRRMRAALLKQVGLHGVAEWDLQSLSKASH